MTTSDNGCIYPASKIRHAAKWHFLQDCGWKINAPWIRAALAQQRGMPAPNMMNLWDDRINYAADCRWLMVYIEPGDNLKGALVEIGAALAYRRNVLIIGNTYEQNLTVRDHRLVRCFETLMSGLSFLGSEYLIHPELIQKHVEAISSL